MNVSANPKNTAPKVGKAVLAIPSQNKKRDNPTIQNQPFVASHLFYPTVQLAKVILSPP
jgi:hypothetical protein